MSFGLRIPAHAAPAATQDFYAHVNAKWLASAVIPADRARWGVWDALSAEVETEVQALLRADTGSLGALWALAVARPESPGARALAELATLAARATGGTDAPARASALASMHAAGVEIAFAPSVEGDPARGAVRALLLAQGGTGLATREEAAQFRAAYTAHVASTLRSCGGDPREAPHVVEIEERLLAASLTPAQRRDCVRTNNARTAAQLPPGLDWDAYLHALGAPACRLYVESDAAIAAGVAALEGAHAPAYALWRAAASVAAGRGADAERAEWGFFEATVRGATAMQPLARRRAVALAEAFPEAVGAAFVAADPQAHAAAALEARIMVRRVRRALLARVAGSAWMSAPTRAACASKLRALRVKVGAPVAPPAGALELPDRALAAAGPRGDWADALLAAARLRFANAMAGIGRSPSGGEWGDGLHAHTVNCCYSASNNDITIPAAVLRPPLFRAGAPAADNVGALGAVVGHELAHALDDEGRMYDARGVLGEWWAPADVASFAARCAPLDAAAAAAGLDAALTRGENIADAVGVRVALDTLGHSPPPAELLAFFHAWARMWASLVRPEERARRARGDPHAAPAFRANAPLRNLSEFATTTGTREGDGMWLAPEARAVIM